METMCTGHSLTPFIGRLSLITLLTLSLARLGDPKPIHTHVEGVKNQEGTDTPQVEGYVNYLISFGYVNERYIQTKDSLTNAIKMFQRIANIPQTGVVDEATSMMMRRKRCGDPDIINEDINKFMGVDEDEDYDYVVARETEPQRRRSRRYALYGTRWPQKEIFYCIVNYPAGTNEQDKRDFALSVAASVARWQFHIPLKITPASCDQIPEPEIKIEWLSGQHHDRFRFDGPGGVLAHAFFPSKRSHNPHTVTGDVHLDRDERWVTEGRPDGTCFPYVFSHELGHSLGLTHSADKRSLMWPFYIPCNKPITLQLDDINGIQALYGVPTTDLLEDALHLSNDFFASEDEAEDYCDQQGSRICRKNDLRLAIASDPSLAIDEWFWIDEHEIRAIAKIEAAGCSHKIQSHSGGCFFDKLHISTNPGPAMKVLCCKPLEAVVPIVPTDGPDREEEKEGPEMALCNANNTFDALLKIRSPKLFKNDHTHTMVFTGNQVFAFDLYEPAKGFPVPLRTLFPGYPDESICSVLALPSNNGMQAIDPNLILFNDTHWFVFKPNEKELKFDFAEGHPAPKAISLWGLEGFPACPRVVFVYKDEVNFIHNNRIWVYTGKSRRVVPQLISSSLTIPADVTIDWPSIRSAASWKPDSVFLFDNNDQYYYSRGRVLQSGYPRKTIKSWFHFCK